MNLFEGLGDTVYFIKFNKKEFTKIPAYLFNAFMSLQNYGLHAYFIFDQPIKITDDNREELKRRNNLFLDIIRLRANGKDIDVLATFLVSFARPRHLIISSAQTMLLCVVSSKIPTSVSRQSKSTRN